MKSAAEHVPYNMGSIDPIDHRGITQQIVPRGDQRASSQGLPSGTAVLEASLQIRVRFQTVSQPSATRRPMRRRTIGPASSGLGETLAGRDVLVLATPAAGWARAR